MKASRLLSLGILLVAALPLTGCKIVPIATEAEAPAVGFDATAYAEGLWSDQALPHFEENARPAAEVLPALATNFEAATENYGYRPGEGSPWSFIVTGEGVVSAKNTESRAGTMEVAVDGGAQPVAAVLQIGPVLRGNAVRDALPFVSFKDFTNQLEYANAGKALTALALGSFSGNVDALAVGDRVRFTGAISVSKAGDAPVITPVLLEKVAP
ncbi:MAG TPA: DUF2291 domain-containing protein [Devosia sp.]|jgi:predicted lipoprotein|uniref:DUF2291 family protein n=1 Tax=Devosia sp. TaxID=1871048 RepID=UPI002F95B53C